MNPSVLLLSIFLSGLLTVFVDQIIRQQLLEKTYEYNKIPPECIAYRRSHTHLLSLFILGVLIFPLAYWLHNYINKLPSSL